MGLSSIADITADKDMEVNLTLNEIIRAMAFLNRDIYHNGILIANTDKNTVEDFPEIMGKTAEEYAINYILSKSPDGTIEAGQKVIAEKTGKDPVRWVGYYLCNQLANEYNRQNGREPVEIFDD